jgi:hypothetical protein
MDLLMEVMRRAGLNYLRINEPAHAAVDDVDRSGGHAVRHDARRDVGIYLQNRSLERMGEMLRAEIRGEIGSLRAEFKQQLAELELRLTKQIMELAHRIERLESARGLIRTP